MTTANMTPNPKNTVNAAAEKLATTTVVPDDSVKTNKASDKMSKKQARLLAAMDETMWPANVASRCLLTPQQLKRRSDPASLPTTTASAQPLDIEYGQSRAIKAIKTALGIHANGYHIFAAGENGLGKRTLIMRMLSQVAASQPTPQDWVYVHNFKTPRTPTSIALPPGEGDQLKAVMDELWLNAKKRLNQRFRSDGYQSQIERIKNQTHQEETKAYEALDAEGKQYDLTLSFRESDNKAVFVPTDKEAGTDALAQEVNSQNTNAAVHHIQTLNAAKSKQAAKSKPAKIDSAEISTLAATSTQTAAVTPDLHQNHMHKRLNQLTIALEQLEDKANTAMEALNQSVATRALTPLFAEAKAQFNDLPAVIQYLDTVMADMVTHVEHIVNGDDEAFRAAPMSTSPSRYAVNVLVSRTPGSGAPMVFEDLPTHLNLLGHVEQITQLGTVMTDVSMIRAGSLHRANGGYLLLEASHLLEHPYAWQGLKRALQSKQIKLSSLEQMLTLTGSLSLAPEVIPLDVKVVLIGEADLYYELLELEPEFNAVFKIRADFHDETPRCPAAEQAIVARMADMIAGSKLLPFDNHAQAAILDHLSLQAEDQNKLSLHSDRLIQLLHESNRHARLKAAQSVTGEDVQQAITDMQERSSYLKELYWQELKEGQQLIDTKGKAVGQLNALTVISYADSEFGMPARLTALIQPNIGAGDILDIERDVELGGSLHAKGMLIMTSYLRALFSQHHALNFSASLAFEQSYAHIDGDSATLSEACALLSALADVPIKQALAITGSMNQLGEVQAVGGINAKIAGFFDACREQGFNGNQGVIIPAANISQLMLPEEIIAAVAAGQFHIYGVSSIHEALALLSDMPVSILTKKGNYSKRSLFGKIIRRLRSWEETEEEDGDGEETEETPPAKATPAPKKAGKKPIAKAPHP
ncbi:ATP-binding protein [Psychrobacter arenosus]|uniref:ATP-binding protein n=1 Tax=Psychrobacter arenosus TaxID=256326 RepID=UPI001D10F352|nr:ATP-binding protein [Psychrobacter arenosus]